jgi:hypothetical protein
MDPTHDSRPELNGRTPAKPRGRVFAQAAQAVAIHLAHLLWPALVYLWATFLDLVYAARLGLLWRSRRKFPDRARDLDTQVASLRASQSSRWSSWKALPAGRRMEIRCAAAVLAAAAILGLRAHLTGGSAAELIAHQPTAHSVSAPSPRDAAPTSSTPSALDQARIDAEHFEEYRKQAAPGQWVIYGVEPVDSASAHLAEARARAGAAEAASTGACRWLSDPNAANTSEKRDACHQAEDRMRAMQSAQAAAQEALSLARNPVVRPVLTRGEVDEWDGFKVLSPVVIKDGNRYRMWYVGCRFILGDYSCGVGHAQSSDGIIWDKSQGPVLKIEDPAVSQDLHSITVVRAGDQYLLWYAIDANLTQGEACSTLTLASSRDGLVWKPQGLALRANCYNDQHLWPSAFADGKTIHLWYADYDSSENGALTHLVSSDGKNWQQAGSTDLGTLGMDPRRLWVMASPAGFRALYAARDTSGHFAILQSPDGNVWTPAGGAPQLERAERHDPALFRSGDQGVPEAPVAIVEPGGTWMWFAVPNTSDGNLEIATAFGKEAQL